MSLFDLIGSVTQQKLDSLYIDVWIAQGQEQPEGSSMVLDKYIGEFKGDYTGLDFDDLIVYYHNNRMPTRIASKIVSTDFYGKWIQEGNKLWFIAYTAPTDLSETIDSTVQDTVEQVVEQVEETPDVPTVPDAPVDLFELIGSVTQQKLDSLYIDTWISQGQEQPDGSSMVLDKYIGEFKGDYTGLDFDDLIVYYHNNRMPSRIDSKIVSTDFYGKWIQDGNNLWFIAYTAPAGVTDTIDTFVQDTVGQAVDQVVGQTEDQTEPPINQQAITKVFSPALIYSAFTGSYFISEDTSNKKLILLGMSFYSIYHFYKATGLGDSVDEVLNTDIF